MKKRFYVFLLFICLVCSSTNLFAGTAYIPHFQVSATQVGHENLMFEVNISNISKITQKITVTFFAKDGSPLANYPAKLLVGSAAEIDTCTDSDGQISTNVAALNSMRIDLLGGTISGLGFGKIISEALSPTEQGFVVAHAIVRDIDIANTEMIYMRPITINGGNPF